MATHLAPRAPIGAEHLGPYAAEWAAPVRGEPAAHPMAPARTERSDDPPPAEEPEP